MKGYMKSMRGKITRMLIAGALLLLTVSSCVDDRYADNRGGVGDGETLVKFSVWLPGSSSTTRALTADEENHVETIDILIFEQGGNWVENARCSGSDITDVTPNGSNISKKSFTIKMHHGTYDMVMLGNARELVAGMNMTGKTKLEILTMLTEQMPAEGKWLTNASDVDYKNIPMWGDIGNVTIDGNTQNLDAKDIHLNRMLARVDVQIATGVRFVLTSVDVYNYNTKGALVPATANWDSSNNRVNAPTVPLNSTLTKGPLEYNNKNSKTEINTTDNKCAMEIYLFEAENHTGTGIHTTGKELLNRTCIVVGGRYGNDPESSYYRADFSTGTGDNEVFLDVQRNHHYTFNITKVGGSGHDTSERAFQGTRYIDFTVEVVNWGDSINVPLTSKPAGVVLNATGRVVALEDASAPSKQMSWAEAMGIATTYNTTSLPQSESYTPSLTTTGCGAYYEGSSTDPKTGKGKWRLPTRTELYEMYERRSEIGGILVDNYWSSTESSTGGNDLRAYVRDMSDNGITPGTKTVSYHVRCVRTQ